MATIEKRVVRLDGSFLGGGELRCCLETVLNMVEHGVKAGQLVELILGKSKMRYPTMKACNNRRFVRYVRILGIIASLLRAKEVISKRALYYLDVSLFVSQRVVDEAVDTICAVLGTNLACLSLRAVEKGLVWCKGGTDAPELIGASTTVVGHKLVVIEKEAIFACAIEKEHREGIVYVTGRGFPDRLTSAFVARLKLAISDVLCVVDCDVYGILIGLAYGLEPSAGWRLLDCDYGYLPLTARDITTMLNLLARTQHYAVAARETQRGLFFGVKRESELLSVFGVGDSAGEKKKKREEKFFQTKNPKRNVKYGSFRPS